MHLGRCHGMIIMNEKARDKKPSRSSWPLDKAVLEGRIARGQQQAYVSDRRFRIRAAFMRGKKENGRWNVRRDTYIGGSWHSLFRVHRSRVATIPAARIALRKDPCLPRFLRHLRIFPSHAHVSRFGMQRAWWTVRVNPERLMRSTWGEPLHWLLSGRKKKSRGSLICKFIFAWKYNYSVSLVFVIESSFCIKQCWENRRCRKNISDTWNKFS